MAWSSPHTYIADEPLQAADLNRDLYYNMLETMPGKANIQEEDTRPYFFCNTGLNQITPRQRGFQTRREVAHRTALTFGDADEFTGPTVSVVTGTSALVIWGCQMATTSATGDPKKATVLMSYAVSGATTIAANDDKCMVVRQPVASFWGLSMFDYVTNLTPGTNTFTCKYWCYSQVDQGSPQTAETGEWRWPTITVIPF